MATRSENITDCTNDNIAPKTYRNCADTNESGRVLIDGKFEGTSSANESDTKQTLRSDGRYLLRNDATMRGTPDVLIKRRDKNA